MHKKKRIKNKEKPLKIIAKLKNMENSNKISIEIGGMVLYSLWIQ